MSDTALTRSFAETLRDYRHGSGKSQLQAALTAGISQRHLSFLELGRAQPGRGVVLALGAALGLTLAQQNDLLLAAGFAPMFRPLGDSGDLEMVERALDAFLESHAPFPALLLKDGHLIRKGNAGASKLFSAVAGVPIPAFPRDKWNIFAMMMKPGPGRERLENWSTTAACLIRRYINEQAHHVRRRDFAESASALAGMPEVKELLSDDPAEPLPPVLLLKYRLGDARLRLFTVISRLHTPLDTRLEDLCVELFVPADPETAEWFRRP